MNRINKTIDISQNLHPKSINALDDFKTGFKKALPIIIGYFPIAISFGVIASQSGLSLFHMTFMSLVVYAGASQFMAANMLMMGALGIELIIATFILNFRHFIMSFSLMKTLNTLPKSWKTPLSLGVTDETFAMISLLSKQEDQPISHHMTLGIMLGSYISWVIGTFFGGLLGMFIPAMISDSMSIALYAMFIALLVPAITDQWKVGIVAAASGLFCWFFSLFLGSGWAIVFATLIGSFIGSFLTLEE
ncbi:AzlC family protein [Alkaliphilus metalliredigens QYMF]|uniref:AzlC family protein n=1 Tax=Alkaliphilus metalliredigens (strain QYMF) TaxID=293826 RepID=A6TMK6_ALKMQ|nr:AzlC family ABC transporter permease [Alkaliphilus metalliredigens]ABR47424.1 AzlC family protein [Alkaliphilus metalliredigens QYMF]